MAASIGGSEYFLGWLGILAVSSAWHCLGVGAMDSQAWAGLTGACAFCRQILELPWKEKTFLVLQSLLERQVSRLPWGGVDREVLQCCGRAWGSRVSDPSSGGGASRTGAP